jgi:FkbM family methyltransferase
LRLALAQRICRSLPPVLSQRVRAVLYPWTCALRDSLDFIVTCQTGSLLKGNTGDFPAYPVAIHGYNIIRSLAIAIAECVRGDTVIEIGANTGTETVSFADIVGPSGKVFAFEPLPSNVALLCQNRELNGASNIVVMPFALADRRGKLRFTSPTGTNSGVGHLSNGSDSAAALEVNAETLDEMAAQIGPAKLIAMDVEGAEILVLRGARQYIQRYRPTMIMESDPRLLARIGFSSGDLYGAIAEMGYEVFEIGKFRLRKLEIDSLGRKSDWLCVASERASTVQRIQASLWKCLLMPCVVCMNPVTAVGRTRTRPATG